MHHDDDDDDMKEVKHYYYMSKDFKCEKRCDRDTQTMCVYVCLYHWAEFETGKKSHKHKYSHTHTHKRTLCRLTISISNEHDQNVSKNNPEPYWS